MVLSTEKKITSSKLLKIKKLEDFNNHWNNYSLKVCSSYSFLEDREIFLIKKELSNFNVKYLVYKNSTFKKFLENNFPDYNANSSFFPEISGESAFLFSNNFDFLKIYQNYKKNNEKFIGFKWGFYKNKFLNSSLLEKISIIPEKKILIASLCFNLKWKLFVLCNILKKIKKI